RKVRSAAREVLVLLSRAMRGIKGPMLVITHVSKSFGAMRAVDDVSLTIDSGEIVGLIGENGAGKTRLMRIVAGELRADSGEIGVSSRASGASRGTPFELARGVPRLAPLARDDTHVGFVHQHFMLVNDF